MRLEGIRMMVPGSGTQAPHVCGMQEHGRDGTRGVPRHAAAALDKVDVISNATMAYSRSYSRMEGRRGRCKAPPPPCDACDSMLLTPACDV